jgi:peptidoglycan/LPS O-acetylase OafA/YrhL
VWPLLVLLCSRRQLLQTCVGLSIVALAMRLLLRDNWMAVYTLTFCRMDALLAGAMVAIVARNAARRAALRRQGRWVVLAAAAAASVLVALPGGIEARSPALRAGSFTLTAILSVGILIATLDAAPRGLLGRVMRSSPLRVLGTYSYGLYVLHSALRPVWARLVDVPTLARTLHSPALAVFLYFVAATAGSLLLAWPSYHFFEKRFLVLKRYFEGDRRPTMADGARESAAPAPQTGHDHSSPNLVVTGP